MQGIPWKPFCMSFWRNAIFIQTIIFSDYFPSIDKHRHCCHGHRNKSQPSASFSPFLFLFLSFTNYRGQRLSPRKWTALTDILGLARHSLLSSLSILAPNHYISSENDVFHLKLQIEWGNEATAGKIAYRRHLLLFLASQPSKRPFHLEESSPPALYVPWWEAGTRA